MRIRFPFLFLLVAFCPGLFAQPVSDPDPAKALASVRSAWQRWDQAQRKGTEGMAVHPWESDAEFRQRRQTALLDSRRPFEPDLLAARQSLRSSVWTLPTRLVQVKVGTFDAKANRWTATVESQAPELPFRGSFVFGPTKLADKKVLEGLVARGELGVRLRYQLDWGDDGATYYLLRFLEWGSGAGEVFQVFGKAEAVGAWVLRGETVERYRPVADLPVAAGPALPGVYSPQIPGSGPFRISTTPVTRDQFWRVVGWLPTPPDATWEAGQWPVDRVSWFQALWFCRLLSQIDGLEPVYTLADPGVASTSPLPFRRDAQKEGWRLPTQEEFFFAAAGGTQSRGYTYVGTEDPFESGWWPGNSGGTLHPVATKIANELGLYDMAGNVWQWLDAPPPVEQWVRAAGGSHFAENHVLGSATAPGLFPDAGQDAHPTPGEPGIGFRVLRQGGQR